MTESLVADRYRLIRRIGVGGMGHVWLARDEVLRRDVAVKEVYLPDGLSEDEIDELHARTLREARAAARLSHPSVIRIYDVLQAADRPWIVMEYVPSRSLAQVIMEDGALPPDRVAVIGLSLLAALTAAHEAGVLHRDVKPGNVLLADDGRIVLTDFGLAVFDDVGMQVTRAGIVHGSPQFIAPERAKDGTSTAATDYWSLGATLYAAVEGRSPYARGSSYATLAALATEPPDAPERAGDLKPLLAGLLRRNPRARIAPAEAEHLLRRVTAPDHPGLIPRQIAHDKSGDVRVEPATASAVVRPPVTPRGLPMRNRREYDERRGQQQSAAPVSPAPPLGEPDVDTDRRMAQAWALATPGPLPAIRAHSKPETIAAPRPDRRRLVLLAAITVIVAAVGGISGYALTNGDPGGRQSTGPPSTRPAGGATVAVWPCTPPAPGSTAPVPSSMPLFTGANGLVDGWIWYTDTDRRYQVAVQERMQLLTGPDLSCFYDPATTRVAGVLRSTGTQNEPAKRLEAQVAALQNGRVMLEFTVIHEAAPVLGVPGSAEAQFTYVGPRGLRMHAALRIFVDKSGVAYTVMWQATELDWPTGESANYQFFWLNFNRLRQPTASP